MKVDRHLSSYKNWGVWKVDTHLILHKSFGGTDTFSIDCLARDQ